MINVFCFFFRTHFSIIRVTRFGPIGWLLMNALQYFGQIFQYWRTQLFAAVNVVYQFWVKTYLLNWAGLHLGPFL
jgi:hypothetical protein